MNFKYYYNKYHKFKFNCDFNNELQLSKMTFGSGGSTNIIICAITRDADEIIIKIIPRYYNENYHEKKYTNGKKYINGKTKYVDDLEIKFYKFFTAKYLLTNKTPHIVGMYNSQICKDFKKLMANIDVECPTFKNRFVAKIEKPHVDNMLCELLLKQELQIIDDLYDVVILQNCPIKFSNVIIKCMTNIADSGFEYHKPIANFIEILNRTLFQLIFTLAIIKNDYPGFLHRDFFVRNILFIYNENAENTYIAYHYNQKIFYLPANGLFAKINDFGMSVIANELEYHVSELWRRKYIFENINPFNEKNDIFNLLHDIYYGQSLDTDSIYDLQNEMNIGISRMRPIIDFLSKFLDTTTIDAINANNKYLLDNTWNINDIPILENTVKTPHQYLMSDIFENYQHLPEDANIIFNYNKP